MIFHTTIPGPVFEEIPQVNRNDAVHEDLMMEGNIAYDLYWENVSSVLDLFRIHFA